MRARHGVLIFAVIAIAGLLTACGRDERIPTAPSTISPGPPAPSVTGITIEGPHIVPTGSNVNYIATALLSNGGPLRNVRPVVWITDNPDVAIINSAPDGYGELTTRKAGVVTVTGTHQGVSGTLTVNVGEHTSTADAARLHVTYSPNPVPGSQAACAGGADRFTPSWSFTERIAETEGVGFTQETLTFNLYDDQGRLVYSDTEFEHYQFDANSVFVEEFCTSLFGRTSGFYTDIFEGVDDKGNRLVFGGERLRLLSVGAASPMSSWLFNTPISSGIVVHSARRRIR